MDRETWRGAAHEIAKNHTCLSDWTDLNWKSVLKMIQEIIQGKIQTSKKKNQPLDIQNVCLKFRETA